MKKTRQTIQEYGEIDFDVIEVREAEGQFIHWAYDVGNQWPRYPVEVPAPDSSKLFNFELPVRGLGGLVVLDPYGDEMMPDDIREKILNSAKMFRQTIGIFRKTGEIVNVGFMKERVKFEGCPEEGLPGGQENQYSVSFWSFDLQTNKRLFLPQSYRKRIDELKSRKRPFYLANAEHSLYAFITRWGSYADLRDNLVIDLQFDKFRLQVWGDSYREVSEWHSVGE